MSSDTSDSISGYVRTEGLSPSRQETESSKAPLDRHLLLALSKHSKAGAGLDFVSNFFTAKEDIHLTLMHIPPAQAAVWAEETSYESLDVLETQAATLDKKGRMVVDTAKRKLMAAGFIPEKIEDKILQPQMSKAHDIIREAREGHLTPWCWAAEPRWDWRKSWTNPYAGKCWKDWQTPSVSLSGYADCRNETEKMFCSAWTAPTRRRGWRTIRDSFWHGSRDTR